MCCFVARVDVFRAPSQAAYDFLACRPAAVIVKSQLRFTGRRCFLVGHSWFWAWWLSARVVFRDNTPSCYLRWIGGEVPCSL